MQPIFVIKIIIPLMGTALIRARIVGLNRLVLVR
jgi:hypothetical protein